MSKQILIGGGSGLIGQRLTHLLEKRGHDVSWLSRTPGKYDHKAFFWKPGEEFIDPAALQNIDAVIQLAGAGIAEERWTDERKQLLRDSRLDSHRTLINAIEERDNRPEVYLAASAIGYYGDRDDELLTEDSEPGEGFLPELSMEWEAASSRAAEAGMRLVQIRIGIVLSAAGGMLDQLIPYFKWGIGPVFGSGEQIYSWIHIDDLCRIFIYGLEHKEVSGVYNATAPSPASNEQLGRAIRSAIGRPGILAPAPAFVLRLMLGEMSSALLDSDRVSCKKIQEEGFSFRYSELNRALDDVLEEFTQS